MPLPIPSPQDVVTTVVPGAAEATAAGRWLADRHNHVRVLWVMSGVSLILAGVVVMAAGSVAKPAAAVAKTAAKVAI